MTVHLVYFSPGGTTRKTVRNIAKGMGDVEVVEHDMLKKENRSAKLQFGKDDVVILGMMTATKLFGKPEEIFGCMLGNDTLLIGVVMFGNGYFGNSLNLMKKETAKRGFRMVAAGAFIGQHSFEKSIAANRPDALDEEKQRKFGSDIAAKLWVLNDRSFTAKIKMDWPRKDMKSTIKCAIIAALPGYSMTLPFSWSQLEISDACVNCGVCMQRCPTGSIEPELKRFNEKICIGCFACANACPNKAISLTGQKLLDMFEHLKVTRKARREPVIYI